MNKIGAMCDPLYDERDYEDIFGILFIGYVKVWWRCDSVAAITYTNGENTNIDLNLFHSKTYNPIGAHIKSDKLWNVYRL